MRSSSITHPSLSEPTKVQALTATGLSSSAIRVRWSSPECPYGVITSYTVFYRQTDTPQTGNIVSTPDYTAMTVESSVEEYVIDGKLPYKNFSIHVQAVNDDNERGVVLLGAIEEEVLNRTHSDVGPAPVPDPLPTDTPGPSASQIVITIGDPRDIDTGRVM